MVQIVDSYRGMKPVHPHEKPVVKGHKLDRVRPEKDERNEAVEIPSWVVAEGSSYAQGAQVDVVQAFLYFSV